MGRIRFEKSDERQEHEKRAAAVRPNYTPGPLAREIEFDDSEGPWIHVHHDTIRTQDGEALAYYNARRELWVDTQGDVWTDITIKFAEKAAA